MPRRFATSPIPIVAVREKRQGKSFALNSGLEMARGDIIALTDDDVIPAPDWLQRIVDDFRERDVTFVFGKVLPWWSRRPPPELLVQRAQAIWGPLAIRRLRRRPSRLPSEITAERLPIGANLALRRDAVVRIGAWRTDLGKVNNTLISGEDHEIFMRLAARRALRGFLRSGVDRPSLRPRGAADASLLPEVVLLARTYHGADGRRPVSRARHDPGAPHRRRSAVHVSRGACGSAGEWLRMLGRKDALDVFIEELQTLQFAGLVVECWQRHLRGPRLPSSGVADSPVPQAEGRATVVSLNGSAVVRPNPAPGATVDRDLSVR